MLIFPPEKGGKEEIGLLLSPAAKTDPFLLYQNEEKGKLIKHADHIRLILFPAWSLFNHTWASGWGETLSQAGIFLPSASSGFEPAPTSFQQWGRCFLWDFFPFLVVVRARALPARHEVTGKHAWICGYSTLHDNSLNFLMLADRYKQAQSSNSFRKIPRSSTRLSSNVSR